MAIVGHVVLSSNSNYSSVILKHPMLMLSARRHFVRITLFIASTPPGSSTECVFSYRDKMTAAARQDVNKLESQENDGIYLFVLRC